MFSFRWQDLVHLTGSSRAEHKQLGRLLQKLRGSRPHVLQPVLAVQLLSQRLAVGTCGHNVSQLLKS